MRTKKYGRCRVADTGKPNHNRIFSEGVCLDVDDINNLARQVATMSADGW